MSDKAIQAVYYVYHRICTDADASYYFGPMTEVFSRVCEAVAEHKGVPKSEIESAASKVISEVQEDRTPEVLWLRRRVEELEAQVERRMYSHG